jgi:hypothetical protein
MYACNIRLELQMEIEQRDVVSYLHRKGMKPPAIVAELAEPYHEDASHENRVKYRLHEIKLHQSDLSDRPSSGRPPLEDIDARILQVFSNRHTVLIPFHMQEWELRQVPKRWAIRG